MPEYVSKPIGFDTLRLRDSLMPQYARNGHLDRAKASIAKGIPLGCCHCGPEDGLVRLMRWPPAR